MKTKAKAPAKTIIGALGGASKVGQIVGVHRSAVWKWTQPREKGGLDGTIPITHIRPLLEATQARGLQFTAEDFLPKSEGAAE